MSVGPGWLATSVILALVVGLLAGAVAGVSGARFLDSRTMPSQPPKPSIKQQVVFRDPLTSNRFGWSVDSHCSFQDGGYLIQHQEICYAPVGSFQNVAITVKYRQIAGPTSDWHGIVFRRTSEGNYYRFGVNAEGAWVPERAINNQFTHLQPYVPTAAIKQGLNVTNTLKVIAFGSHLEFFVNGTMVGHVTNSKLGAGWIGLDSGDDGVQVVYSDLTIARVS